MFSKYSRKPAWHRDMKWLCGVLLSLTIAAATLLFSLAQLTRPELGQRVLQSVLSLTLLPDTFGEEVIVEADEDESLVEDEEAVYEPGEPLTLLPGVDVSVSEAEMLSLDAQGARALLSQTLADAVITDGVPSALTLISDPLLNAQFAQAAQTTLPPLTSRVLESALLDVPAELGTGTRLTDWRLQAQQNPNRNVQPIVGVFVTAPAETLEPLSSREIGEYVVAELSGTLLNEGLAATRERVSREVVSTILAQSAQNDIREQIAQTFSTLLISQDALLSERLAQAQALSEAANAAVPAQAPPETLRGLTPVSALEGLSPEQATERVAGDVAAALYESDVAGVTRQLSDEVQVAQLVAISPLLNGLTRAQHRQFVRYTYIAGFIALALTLTFMYFCAIWERFVGTGISIMAGAALGSLLFTLLVQFLGEAAALPALPPISGIPAYGGDALRYTAQQLPDEVSELFARNHLVVLATGAGLIGLFVLQQFWNLIRPRRGRFL